MLDTSFLPTFRPHAGDGRRSVLRAAISICVLLLVCVLEVTCVNAVAIGRVRPDIILVVLVYVAVELGIGSAVAVAAAGGIIQDALGTGMIGVNVFSKVGVALTLGYAGSRVVIDRPAVRMSLMACATVIHMTLNLCILALAGFHYDTRFYITRLVIPGIFYNSLVMPPVWWIVWQYMRWIDIHVSRGDV